MLCWIVYFSTYLGRLNYSASLSEIILSERFTKSQAGMIGTGFFLAYGGGAVCQRIFRGSSGTKKNGIYWLVYIRYM